MATSERRALFATIRSQLQKRLSEITTESKKAISVLRTPSEYVHDFADHSAYETGVGVAAVVAQQQTREFQEIEEALMRLSRSEYGTCADCGEPIQDKRLQALPTAENCRDCATLREEQTQRLSA